MRGDHGSLLWPQIAGGMSDGTRGRAACGDRRAEPEVSAAASACSRGSKRTSVRTARSTWSPTSCGSSSSSSPRRIRRCASRSIRPRGWSPPCRSPAWRFSVTRRGASSTCGWASARTGRRCSTLPRGGRWRSRSIGSWARQDVPYELAARALEQGCIFALDSDAHSHPEFEFADIAIAHAQARRHSAGAHRQLLGGEEVSGLGARGLGRIACPRHEGGEFSSFETS